MTLQRDWETDRRICDAATPPAFRTDLKDMIFINQAREGWPAALEEIKRLQRLLHTCCFFQQLCADLQSLKEHSKTCQSHPVAAAREEIARLQARVRELEAGD